MTVGLVALPCCLRLFEGAGQPTHRKQYTSLCHAFLRG